MGLYAYFDVWHKKHEKDLELENEVTMLINNLHKAHLKNKQLNDQIKHTILGDEGPKQNVDLEGNTFVSAEDSTSCLKERLKSLIQLTKNINYDGVIDIITVLNDISEQTNLLALNVAMDVARSGEKGNSFSNVANDVSFLARKVTRLSNETRSITDSIKNHQNDFLNEDQVVNFICEVSEVLNSISCLAKLGEKVAKDAEEQKKEIPDIATGSISIRQDVKKTLTKLSQGDTGHCGNIYNYFLLCLE
ncbi:methyl-accepting chemotaxis protein [Vibrio hepatarius]|uniref:methyl-accepting chemotaxis protein n=1 Tax=Vibrio hepatarius TaxID=171383 RepID=UPI001C0A5F13|nr:methyl-accepting chemotaxis protein [Vibrio hepatarius]MBU2895294.1 hypothetical protein [Vibrio hepatarius]